MNSAARGYGSRWRKVRLDGLKNEPLCRECKAKGITKAATDRDHIKPVRGKDDPLFWEPSNHQSLCHECHSRKTMNETHQKMRKPEG